LTDGPFSAASLGAADSEPRIRPRVKPPRPAAGGMRGSPPGEPWTRGD